MNDVKINVNGISITLTKEQIAEIDRKKAKNRPVTERIQTFNDIIAESGKSASYFTDSNLSINELGYRKFVAICEVYNEGWVSDFTDSNQYKWFIYGKDFSKASSSFVGSSACYGSWLAVAAGGSRLCLKSEELAKDIIKKFLKELNQFWC